eukprot:6128379-Heterocapsa_arctica.AAC.1
MTPGEAKRGRACLRLSTYLEAQDKNNYQEEDPTWARRTKEAQAHEEEAKERKEDRRVARGGIGQGKRRSRRKEGGRRKIWR